MVASAAPMARQLVHIESDPTLADEVRRAFAPAGFEVVTVGQGEPAVERCRAARPDLILLAAELPDMSGFSVCNRLKRALGSVPLILYTAEANPSAVEAHRATRTRADDYLHKPFDMADLVGRAAQLLQGTTPAPAAGALAEVGLRRPRSTAEPTTGQRLVALAARSRLADAPPSASDRERHLRGRLLRRGVRVPG